MKRVGKILLTILEIILVLYVILITTFLLCRNKYGYTQFGNNTVVSINENNLDTFSDFKVDDLVVLNYIGYNATNIGDQIYYYDVVNNEYVIKKGTIADKTGDYSSALYMVSENPNAAIAEERVLGMYKGTSYNSIGGVLAFLETTVGFLVFVLLPILVIFMYQLYNLIMLIKEKNSDEKKDLTKKVEETPVETITSANEKPVETTEPLELNNNVKEESTENVEKDTLENHGTTEKIDTLDLDEEKK